MREFFRPFRRKFGMLTLLVACVFAAGWTRSLSDGDVILMKFFGEYFTLCSGNGSLQLRHEDRNISVTVASKSPIPLLRPNPLKDVLFRRASGGKSSSTQRGVDSVDRKEIVLDRSTYLEESSWWQTYRAFDKNFFLGNEQRLQESKTLLGLMTISTTKSAPPKAIFSCPYWSIVLPLALMSAWLLLSKPKRKAVPHA